MFIFILATPDSYRSIGDRFGLNRGNACAVVLTMLKAICVLMPVYVTWPVGNKFHQTCLEFNNLRGNGSFPNVIGCVDGTHIPIKAPKKNDNSFYNRKGFHSALLQVICNARMEFIDIYFGWPGSTHDARVWKNSPIYYKLKNQALLPEDFHLLGDSAYPLDVFIMIPYRDNGHLTARQKKFNKTLSSSRVQVENAIGMLKQVFRRLKYLDADVENLKYYVVAACILHNLRIKNGMNLDIEENENDENNVEGEERGEREDGLGRQKRERLLLSIT